MQYLKEVADGASAPNIAEFINSTAKNTIGSIYKTPHVCHVMAKRRFPYPVLK
jgi:hypothetical protein